MKYSVIVPIHNEKESVRPLHEEIVMTMKATGEPFEIVFVDDGSSDGSYEAMKALSPLTIIRFRKQFGQTAAFDAGFRQAKGDVFITLDGDRQNPPHEIPKLLAKMAEGYDVVCGWRTNRQDSSSKQFLSRGANFLRKFLVNDLIHDSGCSLRVYARECFDDVQLLGEMHRFIPAILRWRGFTIAEVPVEHRPREHGESHYTWKRVIKGFVDMVAVWFWRKYANRPLHLFGGVGIILTGSGAFFGIVLAIFRAMERISLKDSVMPLFAALLIIAGIQFFITGILADILSRMYYNSRQSYVIRSIESTE